MDNGKFVNAYIETANAITHEYLNTVIQLRTQLKSIEEVIADKDSQIGILTQRLEELTQKTALNNQELEQKIAVGNNAQAQLDELKAQNYALANKAAQVDAFMNQITELKRLIIERDEKIEKLTKKTVVPKKTTSQPSKDDF